MNKLILIVPVVILFGFLLAVFRQGTPAQIANIAASLPTPTFGPERITVSVANFSFTPNEIRVPFGATIRIDLVNSEGTHDFTLDEYNIRSPQLQAGKSAKIDFVADKSGTFEYYCSVGQHRALGMVGKLIVE